MLLTRATGAAWAHVWIAGAWGGDWKRHVPGAAALTAHAELGIALHRLDGGTYAVELRCSQPGSDTDIRLVRDGPALAHFDFDGLRALAPGSRPTASSWVP
jgi:hypothetical protein